MSDYIERQAAIDAVRETFKRIPTTAIRAMDTIKALPSADVIPVVRCKDCEWAMKSTDLSGWYMCKCEEAFDYYAKPDDFCSYGKKREEEG